MLRLVPLILLLCAAPSLSLAQSSQEEKGLRDNF